MFSADSLFALDLLWEWRDTLQPGLSPTASIEATLKRLEHHDFSHGTNLHAMSIEILVFSAPSGSPHICSFADHGFGAPVCFVDDLMHTQSDDSTASRESKVDPPKQPHRAARTATIRHMFNAFFASLVLVSLQLRLR